MIRMLNCIVLCVLGALSSGGCSSDLNTSSDLSPISDVSNGAVTSPFSKLSLPELGSAAPAVTGSPTEVYTRIARGVLTCWFGAHGPLKASHIYHAEANPPSKGGQARIVIHKLDSQRRDKRGVRAFAVDIVPDGSSAKLEIHKAKIAEPQGSEMARDVRRWAGGEEGCVAEPLAAGWEPKAKLKKAKTAQTKRK